MVILIFFKYKIMSVVALYGPITHEDLTRKTRILNDRKLIALADILVSEGYIKLTDNKSKLCLVRRASFELYKSNLRKKALSITLEWVKVLCGGVVGALLTNFILHNL